MTEMLVSIYRLVEGVGAALTRDLGRWPIQAVLFLSFTGCLAGILAFRGNPASCTTERRAARHRAMLYWVSLLPSIAWYVLPFLPQTRFRSLMDGASSGDALVIIAGSIGAVVAIWNSVAAMRVVAENGRATGPAMVDFLQPSCLLETGAYERVRHPMFLHDFVTHAGLSVATGALTTVVLLPLYFLISATFNLVEEKCVLEPRFREAFEAYRRKTPGYMTSSGSIALIMLGAAVAVLASSSGEFRK